MLTNPTYLGHGCIWVSKQFFFLFFSEFYLSQTRLLNHHKSLRHIPVIVSNKYMTHNVFIDNCRWRLVDSLTSLKHQYSILLNNVLEGTFRYSHLIFLHNTENKQHLSCNLTYFWLHKYDNYQVLPNFLRNKLGLITRVIP